jgi:hypothetical protein
VDGKSLESQIPDLLSLAGSKARGQPDFILVDAHRHSGAFL